MIIKNCPAYRETLDGTEGGTCYSHCEDVQDCIVKQIVNICKWKLECSVTNDNTSGYYEILNLLNIEGN